MKSFLEYVADDIISKYGTDLSRTVVVFPNKRASLFLNSALAQRAGRPLWSPAYVTISDLFRRHSTLQVADPIKLVCDLHRVYTDVTGFDETLDHFYGWGQLLVTDFDDIDKHMAEADKVFANLRDLRQYDDVSYLSSEQKAVLRHFFSNFSDDHNTLLKERFLRLWSRMSDIYAAFNRRLASQGLAYEGALYRRVAEDPAPDFSDERYLFVGFNLLQQVEHALFTRLKEQGKAHFYWDFDHYYKDTEAGRFILMQMARYPNELPGDSDDIYRRFRQPKSISFVAAPTEDIQARYVSQWLTPQRRAAGRRTAVVLCNEGLLQTVIHCLPPTVSTVNITTGYPLQQTAVGAMAGRLIRKHTLDEVISRIREEGARADVAADPLAAEAVFRVYTLLNRLRGLVASGDLTVDAVTMQRLVLQLIQQTSIPFHGEPAAGLQIMGVLETRNLDFDHLLLLSCNEGHMPRGVNDASFIPYSIRRAYGLTTADHKVALYAYYFNRLLSRASDVTIAYGNAATDGQAAEMSRFMLQLMVEDRYHHIAHHTLQAGQDVLPRQPRAIEKSAAVNAALRRRFALAAGSQPQPATALLTPTAINRYLRCPLQFYYCYVEGLREPDDTEDGVIDNRVFGNIFHNAAQMLYEQLRQASPLISASHLSQLLQSGADIRRAVDAAFTQEFQGHAPTGGMAVINREVIVHYLRQLVEVDRRLAPFTILRLEADVVSTLPVASAGFTTTIGGRVDRLDRISSGGADLVRVIDYKTSAHRMKYLKSADDIFDDSQLAAHTDYYLQTMLYARIVRSTAPAAFGLAGPTPVAPALLFIQHAGTDGYNPVLKLGGDYIADVATPDGDRFAALLQETVDAMFDPSRPFTPTTDSKRCSYCPYAQLCGL